MPHKKAKRSIRTEAQKQRGSDLAPGKQSISSEPIPKSIARVLNAARTHEEFATRKRTGQSEDGPKAKKRKIDQDDPSRMHKIQPGESLQHFNKRVESDMRPLVRAAMQTSLATARNAEKKKQEEKQEKKRLKAAASAEDDEPVKAKSKAKPPPSPSPPPERTQRNTATEFATASSSQPKRLNDIVQAPPDLSARTKKLQKKVTSTAGSKDRTSDVLGGGVLSMRQKAMMEEEREKIIERYRQLKQSRYANNRDPATGE